MHRRARTVQMLHEGLQAAFVCEHVGLVLALIDQLDAHARIQKRQLTQPLGQRLVVELDLVKIWAEGRKRMVVPRSVVVPDHGQGRHGLTQVILLPMHLAIAAHRDQQIVGQSVDDGHADAVQTARDLVRAVVELPAGMQHREDDFGGRPALFRVDIHRDTATIVRYRDRFIRVYRDHHAIAVTGQRLIDRVVDHLKNHVVQTAPSSVSPMYIPGRFRTASRPFKTLILLES